MEYSEMLKRARKNLPESVLKSERFSIQKIRGHIQGNKTVLSNFFQIADQLGRDPNHILKYLYKELATPGETKKSLVILGRKVSASRINDKIREYAQKYVVCKECGKPDTTITKKNRIFTIRCKACGARYPL